MLEIQGARPSIDATQLDSVILDAEIVKRMGRYKRAPSKAQLIARIGPKFGDENVEASLLRLLNAGAIAVTGGTFWLRARKAS